MNYIFRFPPHRKIASLTMSRLIENYDGSGDASVGAAVDDQGAVDVVTDVAAATEGAGTANFVGSVEDPGAANVVASAGEAGAANVDGTVSDDGAAGFVGVGAAEEEGAVGYGGLDVHQLLAEDTDDDIRRAVQVLYDLGYNVLMGYNELLNNGLPNGVNPEDVVERQAALISCMNLYWQYIKRNSDFIP